MLETVAQGFKSATDKLRGVRALSEENVDDSLREVRRSLLEGDVDLEVVREFLGRVKDRALGEKIETRARDRAGRKIKITPGQHFVAICEEELVALMGPVDTTLARADGAISIMLVGLQGVGKTTVAAKLARKLEKDGKRPLLVAADIYRPAAIDQLRTLGEQLHIPVHTGAEGELPPSICRGARERARRERHNAIIYDTAGRLAVDQELMQELREITEQVSPANILLVCDALMGRDAINVANAFKESLDLDGICLTKLDGDARGGAALSVKAVTGVPIKFLGTGESLDRLEDFRPEGLASRILGMGDVVGLVKDFEEVVDEKQAEEDAERILKGQFTLDDLITQLGTIQKMGSLKEVFAKMPGMGGLADQVDEGELVKVKSLVGSMTKQEKQQPRIIDTGRARRIARGSGHKPKDVSDLVKRFDQMKELMGMLGRQSGRLGQLPGMGNFGAGFGGMPSLAGAGMPGMDPRSLLGGAVTTGGMRSKNDDARRKKKRKQAKKSRQKGRKKR